MIDIGYSKIIVFKITFIALPIHIIKVVQDIMTYDPHASTIIEIISNIRFVIISKGNVSVTACIVGTTGPDNHRIFA